LRQVDVGQQQQTQQQQRVTHPDGPQHIEQCYGSETCPTGLFHAPQALLERTGLTNIFLFFLILFILDIVCHVFDVWKIFAAKLLNNVEMALTLHYKKHFLDIFGGALTKIK
jgi:hypothetical protein